MLLRCQSGINSLHISSCVTATPDWFPFNIWKERVEWREILRGGKRDGERYMIHFSQVFSSESSHLVSQIIYHHFRIGKLSFRQFTRPFAIRFRRSHYSSAQNVLWIGRLRSKEEGNKFIHSPIILQRRCFDFSDTEEWRVFRSSHLLYRSRSELSMR